MKRAVALVLLVVMLLSLTACSEKQVVEEVSPREKTERAEKTEKTDKADKPGKAGEPEKTEEPDKPDEPEPEKPEEPTPEPEPTDEEKARAVLDTVAYFGDKDKCAMTGEQALAYASLIAQGVLGRAEEPYGEFSPAFWDTGFSVYGYSGPYRTDRKNAVLADFAGDGNPYLYVFSSLVSDTSFDVYGWDGAEARYVYGDEGWGGRWSTWFDDEADGTATVTTAGASGALSHGGITYGFAHGDKVEVYDWDETYDYEAEVWRETVNGEVTTYTQEEWDKRESEPLEPEPERTAPWPALAAVEEAPSDLYDLYGALANYAGYLAHTTVTPLALSDRQAMAKAMFAVLDAHGMDLTDETYGQYEAEAALFDLDGDGAEELLLAEKAEQHEGVFDGGRVTVYTWKDGALTERVVEGNGCLQIKVVRDTATGEVGFDFMNEIGGCYMDHYVLGDRRESVSIFAVPDPVEEGEEPVYEITVNGETADKAAYDAITEKYEDVLELYGLFWNDGWDFYHPHHTEETSAKLEEALA